MPEKRLTLTDTAIVYDDRGEGIPVVLLHGLTASKAAWEPNLPVFARRFRVVAPDLPGHGRSDKRPTEYGITGYVRTLTEFLDRLDVGSAHFIGHSMGGHISLLMALTHPDRVRSLGLIDSAGTNLGLTHEKMLFDPRVALAVPRESWVPFPRPLLQQTVKWVFHHGNEWADRVVSQQWTDQSAPDGYDRFRAIAQSALSILDTNLTDRLGDIRVPTLILWGERDRLLKVANAHLMAERIPGAELIRFEDCGHCPQLERPDEFNATMTDWLDRR